MTTLDDLLALFPDNSSGEISAADMREAMNLIAQEFQQNGARISALEQANPAIGISVSGIWQLFPGPGAIPDLEQVTCDTGLFGTATVLNFSHQASGGTDLSNVIAAAVTVYGQQQTDAANWVRYTVTAPGTNHGTYTSIPVTVADEGGVSGSALWSTGIFVFTAAP